MKQNGHKFLNYRKYDNFVRDLRDGKVSNDNIAFIQDKRCIWARGNEYLCDGSGKTSIVSNGLSFYNSGDEELFNISIHDGQITLRDSSGAVYTANVSQGVDTTELADVATSGNYEDLKNKPEIPVIPTKVSSFINDAGYLTQHQNISDKANIADVYTKREVETMIQSCNQASQELPISTFRNDKGYLTSSDVSTVAMSGYYADLKGKPEIPVVPTKVSAFENDKGYLTEHQDISDKANRNELFSKDYNDLINTPEPFDKSQYYTKSEINLKFEQSGTFDSSQYYTKGDIDGFLEALPTIPTKVSAFENDSNYATKSELFSRSYNDLTDKPQIPTKLSDLEDDIQVIQPIQDVPTKVSELENDLNFLIPQDIVDKADRDELFSGSYNDLTDKPEIPSIEIVSQDQYDQLSNNNELVVDKYYFIYEEE